MWICGRGAIWAGLRQRGKVDNGVHNDVCDVASVWMDVGVHGGSTCDSQFDSDGAHDFHTIVHTCGIRQQL